MSAQYTDPEGGRHMSVMLPGAAEQSLVVNAADLDEQARMKGFGGEQANRMIMQALGKDPDKRKKFKAPQEPRYGGSRQGAPCQVGGGAYPEPSPAPAVDLVAASDPYGDAGNWADNQYAEAELAEPAPAPSFQPTPPPGTKV